MTPEREREIRKIAGREGQTWRSSAVSLVALNEVLDELERLRGAAESFRSYLDLLGERHNELANRSESARHRDAYIAIAGAIAGIEAQGRTLGLFKDNS